MGDNHISKGQSSENSAEFSEEIDDINSSNTARRRRFRRMPRGAAITFGALAMFASAASADVLVQNFMRAEFTGTATPCLIKTVGEDIASFPDGFSFDATTTTPVDDVNVTEEFIEISGVTGDRVLADEVFVIENNCAEPVDVQIVNGEATGDWTGKHLEVWLGNLANAGAYPSAVAPGASEWDQAPVVMGPAGVTNGATGVVVAVPSGGSVPVGMVVTTGTDHVGTGTATWTVQAEYS